MIGVSEAGPTKQVGFRGRAVRLTVTLCPLTYWMLATQHPLPPTRMDGGGGVHGRDYRPRRRWRRWTLLFSRLWVCARVGVCVFVAAFVASVLGRGSCGSLARRRCVSPLVRSAATVLCQFQRRDIL